MTQTIVIALVTLGILLPIKAQSSNTVKELTALENRFSQALLAGDWKSLAKIEADELIFTNDDGYVTHKTDDVTNLRSRDMKFESIAMSDINVQDFGEVAVVTGKLVEKGEYKGADFGGAYRFTDVWAKRNGEWQLVAGQETRVQTQLK